MFWGMTLKPNRKYTQTTSKSFHISQAALDCEGLGDDTSNKIYISGEDNQKFLICTLRKNICEQAMLDLNFAEGDNICFQSIGSGNVSLSGYLTVDTDMFDDGEEEEDELSDAEENEAALPNGKDSKNKKKQKKPKAAAGSDEEDEEDDDEDEDALLKAALESDDDEMESDGDEEEDEDDDGDDDEEDEEDEEDDDEEVEEPKPKIAKVDKKEGKQQQQNGVAQKSKKEKKAEKQQQKQQQQQSQQKTPASGERSLAGGVKIEDLRVGNGPEAKTGKRAQVYYEGRLKSNNKTFDSLKNGAPFKFSLGRGEVIKGWDVGVVGMKVGGKRRITCPPHMAYGARGSPPTIPPNSTLVFEVELKGVN